MEMGNTPAPGASRPAGRAPAGRDGKSSVVRKSSKLMVDEASPEARNARRVPPRPGRACSPDFRVRVKAVFVLVRLDGRSRGGGTQFGPVVSFLIRISCLPSGRRSVQPPIWGQRVATDPGVRPVCHAPALTAARRTPSFRSPGILLSSRRALAFAGRRHYPDFVPLEIQFTRAGMYLPQIGLWLDARKRQRGDERVFVSHAHADHIAAHQNVILTAATSLFMRSRLPGQRRETILNFGQRTEFRHGQEIFHLTALPAGHILGSAMAFIEWRGESLLYTGDFKLRESLAAEKCEPRHSDVLIMETTFGLPHYRFPEEAHTRRAIADFCHTSLADGATPARNCSPRSTPCGSILPCETCFDC